MKLLILFCSLFVSACSTYVIDMTAEPTKQAFDLTDPEGDGVIEARDECSSSYNGAKVSNNGCGTYSLETVRLKLEVNFETDSYVVKQEYFPEIEKLSDFMTEFPETFVSIEGHTSIRGKASYNTTLSQNRAQAIKDILLSQFSISEERVSAIGYGFSNLLLEGNDEYIHAKNRRIVAQISGARKHNDMKWTIYSVDEELE
jgi:OOP family OmpA-OmpF porin